MSNPLDVLAVPVILNGPGRVGMSFVRLLEEKTAFIQARTGLRPVLVAVTDVGRSLFNPRGLSLADVLAWKAESGDRAVEDAGDARYATLVDILDRVLAGIGRCVLADLPADPSADLSADPSAKGDPSVILSAGPSAERTPSVSKYSGSSAKGTTSGSTFAGSSTSPSVSLSARSSGRGTPFVRGFVPGIVVEATPTNLTTGEPGLSHIAAALERGFSAITLAKGPLVVDFHGLLRLAAENGAGLRYSGAVAAALPTVDTAMYCLAGMEITEIEGVLNGTTNYILNSMAGGRSYADALKEAQAMGVAEADPSLDVEGFDSAAKLLIIANTVWGTRFRLQDVRRQGITHLSGQDVMESASSGTPVRLVARARLVELDVISCKSCESWDSRESRSVAGGSDDSDVPEDKASGFAVGLQCKFGPESAVGSVVSAAKVVDLSVGPEPVPKGHPFAHLTGTQKAVRFVSREMGDIVVSGGASDVVGAAASALKDLIHLLEEKVAKT
ncbi:MAG: hypothetical protein ACOX3V_04175 [Bacillota bacterium]